MGRGGLLRVRPHAVPRAPSRFPPAATGVSMLVTKDNVEYALKRLAGAKTLAVDLETTGLRPFHKDRMAGIATYDGEEAFYFPFRHGYNKNLPMSVLRDMGPLLSDPNKVYLGHNYSFDLKFLYRDGIGLPRVMEDTMIAAHLMNENEPTKQLKPLSDKYLGEGSSIENTKLHNTLNSFGMDKGDMWKLPPEMVEAYACDDVRLTWALREFYLPHLAKWKLEQVYRGVNHYSLVVTKMEIRGFHINWNLVDQYEEEARKNGQIVLERIQKEAGYPINPASPKQVQAWLGVKSSAAAVLDDLIERGDKRAQLIRDFREWGKVVSSYYRPFRQNKGEDGRLHPSFFITGTETTRISCGKPINFQGIARRTEIYKVKDVFEATPGYVMVNGDYKQAEIYVASHFGKEKNMTRQILSGEDIHTATAQRIKIPRDAAKRINFSVIYGIGSDSLAENLKIPRQQAQEYLENYHQNYPGFKRLLYRCQEMAEARGYIRLFTGRMMHYNDPKRETRKASSNLIQGCVGEQVRVAQNRIDKELPEVLQFHQVHDSIMSEVPEDRAEELIKEKRRIMEDTPWCSIPLRVDIETGNSWGSLK